MFRYNRSRCGPCNLASLLPRTPRGLIDGANISSSNYPNHLPNLSSLPLFVECWETLYRFLAISLSIGLTNSTRDGASLFWIRSFRGGNGGLVLNGWNMKINNSWINARYKNDNLRRKRYRDVLEEICIAIRVSKSILFDNETEWIWLINPKVQ